MASSTPDPDGTEDVNDFLQRIRQLGEQRDKEDEERTKKLEEEILQGRRERQARRAERARSLSPTKDSPVLDAARLSISSIGSRPIDPPEHLEPTTQTADLEASNKPDSTSLHDSTLTEVPEEPKANEYEMDTSPTRPTPPSPLARSRTGTLSWQQRPLSRDFGSRSLFSTSPTRANRLRSMSTATSESQGQERSPSRDQNTHAWSANDTTPAPRQTTDSELESPTLPKSTADDVDSNYTPEVPATVQGNAAEQEKQSSHHNVDERSRSPSRASSTFGDSTMSNRYSSMSSVSTATGLGSPLPLSNAQRFEPPKTETTEEQLPPSPTQRRLSPERPSSPTKGLGGFVQSAMMKRSDSVSKRWSAQLPSGLTRGNSTSSNRNSIAVPNYGESFSATSPTKLGKDAPSFLSHRPSSSHSEATIVNNRRGSERPSTPPVPNDGNDNSTNTKTEESVSRPLLSLHARSASTLDKDDRNADPNATSPVVSRTMDPKRWSPTKASWLESALNRPDSPRHKKQPSQTSWKDRQSRGSVDLGRSSSFKEVTPSGLMRPVPPGNHYKKPSITGLPDLSGTLDTSKGKEPEPLKESEPATEKKEEEEEAASSPLRSPSPEKSPQQKPTSEATMSDVPDRKPAPLTLTSTPNIAPSPLSARDPTSPRPKAQSPIIDFRANLRKREVAKEDTPKDEPEPEFKNVFGRLKKAETNTFVPQNELKDNILKGRAALNATGGPKKNFRTDDIKESILKQKEVIKSSGGLSRRNTAGENDAPAKFVPEAIAKRQNLSKSSSVRSSNAPSSPSTLEPGTPRDLQSLKSATLSFQTEGATDNPESPQLSPTPTPDQHAAPEPQPQPQPEPQPTDLASPLAEPSPGIKDEEQTKKDDEPETKQKDSSASEETSQPVRALPSETVAAVASPPAPAATEGLAAKGNKLAGRINPALAGLLSRGPAAAAASDGSKALSSSNLSEQSKSELSPGAPLTHATKNRARGPRRRRPGATATNQSEAGVSQPEPSFQIEQPPAGEAESFVPKDEPSAAQFELPVTHPEASVHSSHEAEKSAPNDEPSAAEPELSDPKGELQTVQTELPISQPEASPVESEQSAEPSAPTNEPDIESEPTVTQPELPVLEDEVSTAQIGLPVSQPESFAQPELASPNDEPRTAEVELPTSQPETSSVQNEQSAIETERSMAENEPAVAQRELDSPIDEPRPAQIGLPVNQPEPLVQPEPALSKDEPLTAEFELPTSQPETSSVQNEQSVIETERFIREDEPSIAQPELASLNDEPRSTQVELPTGQPETSSIQEQLTISAEHSVPEEKPLTAQPEPATGGSETSDGQLKSPALKDDFQFKFPVTQTEQSAAVEGPSVIQPEPKDEFSAPSTELTASEPKPAMQSEPSVTQHQLDLPKDDLSAPGTELTASEPEHATQSESSVPRDDFSQFEFSVTQTEQSTWGDETSSAHPELSDDFRSSVLELPVPKDEPSQFVLPVNHPEPPASEPESFTAQHDLSSAPTDESQVSSPKPLVSEPEQVVLHEQSTTEPEPSVKVIEPEPSVAKEEPPATQIQPPASQPEVPPSELEPSAQENGLSAAQPEPAQSEPKSITTQPELAPKSEPAPLSGRGSSFKAARSVFERSVGDSNSNWPLPDSQPTVLGNGQPEHSPSAEKGLKDTTRDEPTLQLTPEPKSKIAALSPRSFHSYEDVENLGDSPAQRPAVPPKSPRTPTTEQRWSPRVRYSSQSPSPLRTSYKENQMDSPVGSPSQRSMSGFTSKLISSRHKSLPSPPVPPKRSDTQFSSPRSSASLVPQADESLEVIAEFFTTFPKTSDRVDIDPQLMLTSRDSDSKIRTVKKQVWEITSEGKRQDLPINQEYILYEGSMYLCVHTFKFESDGSTRSETHLWCGDDVPDHAIDDAQTFARKAAKENSCKLEIIKQGKETARFIQALGGILITRRGSNSRSSLSALYMLCGRKHLKQMVFDEVDFSRRNLCSGFPFVISAPFGKLYLWKGKGSTAEEIGAARLIGMDLGLTGEFEEVTEGEEPESFFEIFNYRDTEEYLRSDDWQLKLNHEQFRCRLFRVDHELGQRSGFWIRRPGSSSPIIRPNDTVQEIEPYCSKDISPKGIYILDTYFELYVIVGEQASHRPAEFASAVVFAHEYGILAASLQDRPFIPKSYVSIGGTPNACRSAFRKWHKETWRLPPQVFPLNAAIDAIRT